MITEAKNQKFKIGNIYKSPAGKQIEITRDYHCDGSNMYHYKYVDTGLDGYHSLNEKQLERANKNNK